MIAYLQLHNFKCFKDVEVQFSPGLNVIAGSTDSGKSALISALRWVAENRPLGDSMRADGGGETVVAASIGGEEIARTKGAGNYYSISDRIYEGFGSSVPAEISAAIGMNELNFQWQHDPPFMLSMTPGEAGRLLNRVTDLEVISKSISAINRVERGEKERVSQLRVQREELQKQLLEFEGVDSLAITLTEVGKTYGKYLQTESRIELLEEGLGVLREGEKRRRKLEKLIKLAPQVDRLLAKAKQGEEMEERHSTLLEALIQIEGVKKRRVEIQEALAVLREELGEKMPAICPLCEQPIKGKKWKGKMSRRS